MYNKLILCVDDEKSVLYSLKSILTRHLPGDIKLEFAESGAEALDVLFEYQNIEFETIILITDWIMPNMKGGELLQRVYELHPSICAIVLTGQATSVEVNETMKSVSNFQVLSKPWTESNFLNAIQQSLKQAKV